jgi:diacylglycerol kinase
MKNKNAFIHAARGITYCLRHEPNFKIELAAALVTVAAGIFFSINPVEWLFIVACCIAVLSLELINTALEYVCDIATREFHPTIKIAKDTAAGAVLICAIGSAITGCIIFLPKIIYQLNIFL